MRSSFGYDIDVCPGTDWVRFMGRWVRPPDWSRQEPEEIVDRRGYFKYLDLSTPAPAPQERETCGKPYLDSCDGEIITGTDGVRYCDTCGRKAIPVAPTASPGDEDDLTWIPDRLQSVICEFQDDEKIVRVATTRLRALADARNTFARWNKVSP